MDIYWDMYIYIYLSKSTILRRDNGINISRYLSTWFNVGILSRSRGFTINLWQLWHGENEVLRRWSFGIRVSCFGQHPMENLWEITGKMIRIHGEICHLCLKHMWFPKKGGRCLFFGIFGLRHQPWKGWPNFMETMWHGGQTSWIESQF